MKHLLVIFLAFSCCHRGFALTADQLAQFLDVTFWDSEIVLPPGSFHVEVLEISDGKVGKAVTPVLAAPEGADQSPSATGNTPIQILWRPSDHGLFLTVTMGGGTQPCLIGACKNFQGLFARPFETSGLKTIKEGDYILGGEPLLSPDGTYHVTNNIKDYQRGLLLRVSKKA